MAEEPILKVENLTKYFNTPKGLLHAVDGLNFTVEREDARHRRRIWLRQIDYRKSHP